MNVITCPTPPHPNPPHLCIHAPTGNHRQACPSPASSHERYYMPHPTPPHPPDVYKTPRPSKGRGPTIYIYIYIHTSVKQILDWEVCQLFLSQTHHLHEFACKGRTMANFNGLKQNIRCEKRLGVISAHLWQIYLPFPGFLHLNGLDFITMFYLIFGLYKNNTNWTKWTIPASKIETYQNKLPFKHD